MPTFRSDRLPRGLTAPKAKLTDKQRRFAELLALGWPQVDAFRECYPHSKRWRGRRAASAALRLSKDARVMVRRADIVKRAFDSRFVVPAIAADIRH